MKRKLLAAALAAACLSVAAYGTVAYFTAEDTAVNVITAGNIAIELQETAIPEGGGDPVPFEDLDGVMPGAETSKIVEVKNTGDNPAYIRIRLETAVELAAGGEGDASLLSMDINTESWTERDGYYYYNEKLAAGETSAPLFTTVTFSKDMGDAYQNGKATVSVFVSATQAEHNGGSALDAAGWPAE